MKRVLSAAVALAIGISITGVAPTIAVAAGPLVLVVNSTGDARDTHTGNGICRTATGTCTLRAAIQEANEASSAVTIDFDIPGPGPYRIAPAKVLPVLSNPSGIAIDGYSQPGAAPNTRRYGSNAHIAIQLVGHGANAFDALKANAGSNVFRGLSIYNFRHAIRLYGAHTAGNQILGDFICTNPAGTWRAPTPFFGGGGVVIVYGSNHNYIGVSSSYTPGSGPPSVADRNVISGCANRGVIISFQHSDYNVIQDNVIGLNPRGTAALPNLSHGVDVNYVAQHNMIGGPNPGEGNVISGNNQEGVEISHGTYNWYNDVIGNFIGTGISGTTAPAYARNRTWGIRLEGQLHCNPCAPNAGYSEVYDNVVVNNRRGGILIDKGQQHNTVYDNWIGTLRDGTRVGNGQYGIRIEHGAIFNTIGPSNVIAYNPVGIEMDAVESAPRSKYVLPTHGNTVTQNSIYSNTGLGIDLAPYGEPNVNGVTDKQVQHGIPTPKIRSVTANSVAGTACDGCTVEVFGADTDSVTVTNSLDNFGEGKTYLGSTTASSAGKWSFTPPTSLQPGTVVTADATDKRADTSEFARDYSYGLSAPRVGVHSTNSSLRLRWTAPDTFGGPAINSYLLRLFSGGALVAHASVHAFRSHYRFTGLQQHTRYVVKMAAHTSAGYGATARVPARTKIASKVTIAASTAHVRRGQSLTLNGRLTERDNGRGLGDQRVVVLRLEPSGRRLRVARVTTRRLGGWSTSLVPSRTGRYVALFRGAGPYARDRSRPTRRVVVRA